MTYNLLTIYSLTFNYMKFIFKQRNVNIFCSILSYIFVNKCI